MKTSVLFSYFSQITLLTQKLFYIKVYDPKENLVKNILKSIMRTRKENKNVLIQIRGDWCLKLGKFFSTDPDLKRELEDNYVVYHLNCSVEKK